MATVAPQTVKTPDTSPEAMQSLMDLASREWNRLDRVTAAVKAGRRLQAGAT